MLTQDDRSAKVLLILISDDASHTRQLKNELGASGNSYLFRHIASNQDAVVTVEKLIAQNQRKRPIVLLADYRLIRTDCEALLQLVRNAARSMAIESVITNPPADEKKRKRLSALGATLFDTPVTEAKRAPALADLTLH